MKFSVTCLEEYLGPFSINEEKPYGDLVEVPQDIYRVIFSYLEKSQLSHCRSVCKQWKILATDENLWMRLLRSQGSIIGADEWKNIFIDIGEVPPLPKKALDFFAPCPIIKDMVSDPF